MTENIIDNAVSMTMTKSSDNALENVVLTIGQQLQKAREAKSLTQEVIAKYLFVSTQLINDLENDNYLKIAAPVYARGYIASYARFLQIPAERLLREFDKIIHKAEHQFLYNPEMALASLINKNRKLTGAEKFNAAWDAYGNIAMIGAFVLAVLFLIIYGYYRVSATKSMPVTIQSIVTAPAQSSSPAITGSASVSATTSGAADAKPAQAQVQAQALPVQQQSQSSTDSDTDKE
jgi:cytoskeletal protein RodZ